MRCPVCHHPNPRGEPATERLRARVLCDACGYDSFRRAAATAEQLPRPAKMSADEFAHRTALYLTWLNEPASAYLAHLTVFADWLADNGRAEEAAARADWETYGNGRTADPRGFWSWSVRVDPGWTKDPKRYSLSRYVAHNGQWFLGWPPGGVRFTSTLRHDRSRYRVTFGWNRLRLRAESLNPYGYAALFHPPKSLPSPGDDPRLFDDTGAA